MFWRSKEPDSLQDLENRVRAILPEEYQDSYETVQPVSMGSAGLKYGKDGKVAWDEIWSTFCDLAMAGGPPHKGTLLQPGAPADVAAAPDRYHEVVEEIRRGVRKVTGFPSDPSPNPGWVRVQCDEKITPAWLLRAITMENISVRAEGDTLDLPAAPHYRVEKEIKNVITSIAKTCHYWIDHTWASQQRKIGGIFDKMSAESPLLEPIHYDGIEVPSDAAALRASVEDAICRQTSLARSQHDYAGWLGFECGSVRPAIWMMRALVASNVLSRREDTALFVPFNPTSDPSGERVTKAVKQIHQFALAKGVF